MKVATVCAECTCAPPYKAPFRRDEIIGRLEWSRETSKQFEGGLYHACHFADARRFLASKCFSLRSTWKFFKKSKVCCMRGLWCGLNEFQDNRYGPLEFTLDIRSLEGRSFWVIERKDSDRIRWFFVQFRSGCRFFSGRQPKCLDIEYPFRVGSTGRFSRKADAIYDFVFTTPIRRRPLDILSTTHNKCIPKTCKGVSLEKATQLAKHLKRRYRSHFNGL